MDQLDAAQPDEEVRFEKSPIDEILQMTFPIDPSLRHKVQEQIRVTASQLPLEQNDAVVSYINYFSSPRGKKILAYGLRRSGRYKPMIEKILREEGIPEELIFLAQAESGFVPRAMSRAMCVGVWQFAAFRGKEYGLNQTTPPTIAWTRNWQRAPRPGICMTSTIISVTGIWRWRRIIAVRDAWIMPSSAPASRISGNCGG